MDSWNGLDAHMFGDGPELADELLGLILQGKKTATCWDAAEGLKGAAVGKPWAVKDGQGVVRCVLETVELTQRRFCDVDAAFAFEEGEDDRTLASWRRAHEAYFTRNGGFAPDMLLNCERFRLVEVIDEAAEMLPLRGSSGEAGEGASSPAPALKPPPALRATSPCGGGTEESVR